MDYYEMPTNTLSQVGDYHRARSTIRELKEFGEDRLLHLLHYLFYRLKFPSPEGQSSSAGDKVVFGSRQLAYDTGIDLSAKKIRTALRMLGFAASGAYGVEVERHRLDELLEAGSVRFPVAYITNPHLVKRFAERNRGFVVFELVRRTSTGTKPARVRWESLDKTGRGFGYLSHWRREGRGLVRDVLQALKEDGAVAHCVELKARGGKEVVVFLALELDRLPELEAIKLVDQCPNRDVDTLAKLLVKRTTESDRDVGTVQALFSFLLALGRTDMNHVQSCIQAMMRRAPADRLPDELVQKLYKHLEELQANRLDANGQQHRHDFPTSMHLEDLGLQQVKPLLQLNSWSAPREKRLSCGCAVSGCSEERYRLIVLTELRCRAGFGSSGLASGRVIINVQGPNDLLYNELLVWEEGALPRIREVNPATPLRGANRTTLSIHLRGALRSAKLQVWVVAKRHQLPQSPTSDPATHAR